MNKKGKIKVNLFKLLIIGIPSLVMSILPILVLLHILPYDVLKNSMESKLIVFQILLGYISLNCIYKENIA